MKRIKLLSDYTSKDEPNYLNIIRDDQGDIHIDVYRGHETERGVRIAASGTRHSHEVRQAFYRLVDALEAEKRPQLRGKAPEAVPDGLGR